jgi:hypothetical protein
LERFLRQAAALLGYALKMSVHVVHRSISRDRRKQKSPFCPLPAEQHNANKPQMGNLLAKTACWSDHTSSRNPQAFGAIHIRIIHVNISQELSSINMVGAEPQLDYPG